MWDGLFTCRFLQRKGKKVAACRWFSWMDAMRELSEEWTYRLLVLLYAGLYLGYISTDSPSDLVACVAVVASSSSSSSSAAPAAAIAPANAGDTSLAANKKELQLLRDKSKNTFHLALMVHQQERFIAGTRILIYATRSLNRWYSKYTHDASSCEANRGFVLDLVSGGNALVVYL